MADGEGFGDREVEPAVTAMVMDGGWKKRRMKQLLGGWVAGGA